MIQKNSVSRNKEKVKEEEQLPIKQQVETRNEVIQDRAESKRHVWKVDIESRITKNEKMTVLLVDDTESDREAIYFMLVELLNNDVVIHEAKDGQDAFEKVQAGYLNGWKYDLVLMDLNMAGYDGAAGISMIRGFEKRNKITKPINICAVSGDDFDDNRALDKFNLVSKIKKPISSELVRKLLKKLSPAAPTTIGSSIIGF